MLAAGHFDDDLNFGAGVARGSAGRGSDRIRWEGFGLELGLIWGLICTKRLPSVGGTIHAALILYRIFCDAMWSSLA
jgi:hypothetical protein